MTSKPEGGGSPFKFGSKPKAKDGYGVVRRVAKRDVTPKSRRGKPRRLAFESEEECLNSKKRRRQSVLTSYFTPKSEHSTASENPPIKNRALDSVVCEEEYEDQKAKFSGTSQSDNILLQEDQSSSVFVAANAASPSKLHAISPLKGALVVGVAPVGNLHDKSPGASKHYVTPIKGKGGSWGTKATLTDASSPVASGKGGDEEDAGVGNFHESLSDEGLFPPSSSSLPESSNFVSPVKNYSVPRMSSHALPSRCDDGEGSVDNHMEHAKRYEKAVPEPAILTLDSSPNKSQTDWDDEFDHCFASIPDEILLQADGGTQTEVEPSYFHGLNPSQREAVNQPLYSITRVMAGPGAGKTRVLTCRIAFLLHHDPGSGILAVTFTRKAAGEICERVKNLLIEQERVAEYGGSQQEDPTRPERDGVNEAYQASNGDQVPKELRRATLGTFHSVCVRILHMYGQYLDSLPCVVQDTVDFAIKTLLNGKFDIVDSKMQSRVVKECLVELGETPTKKLVIETVQDISHIKAERFQKRSIPTAAQPELRVKAENVLCLASLTTVQPEEAGPFAVYRRYRSKLLSRNMLDFDDLLYLATDLLSTHPDIQESLKRRWNHILVDEFQDTSKVQLDLVTLLTSSSLLVVGDADQCIYSWRGANVRSMSNFVGLYPDVTTVQLIENYRSTPNIVRAAHSMMASAERGAPTLENANFRQKVKPMRGEGPEPQILPCLNAEQQAQFVVQEIQNLLEEKLCPIPTVAILYRTKIQSRELEDACVEANLPYKVHGRSSFFQRAEVADCLCFLQILAGNGGEHDKKAMLRAFKTPTKGIGKKTTEEFTKYCELVNSFCAREGKPKLSTLDVLISLTDFQRDHAKALLSAKAPTATRTISVRAIGNLRMFSTLMHQIREIAHSKSLEQLLLAIIDMLDLRGHLAKTYGEDDFEKRWGNVEKLRSLTQKYHIVPCLRPRQATFIDTPFTHSDMDKQADGNSAPIKEFLDRFSPDSESDDESDVDDASDDGENRFLVHLMTIHASKGKEFDAVFMVGNEEGTLPIWQPWENILHVDEERRLCYVAMTRAKTFLYMTWRQELVLNPSFTKKLERSRFLNILPDRDSKALSQYETDVEYDEGDN